LIPLLRECIINDSVLVYFTTLGHNFTELDLIYWVPVANNNFKILVTDSFSTTTSNYTSDNKVLLTTTEYNQYVKTKDFACRELLYAINIG
jgi:hypothetical protein